MPWPSPPPPGSWARNRAYIGFVAVLSAGAFWFVFRPAPADRDTDWTLDLGSGYRGDKPLDPKLLEIVDRVASPDASRASAAWLELGAKYRDPESYVNDLRPALWDTRPVSFALVRETFSGNGPAFTYYTVKSASSKGPPAFAHTVGQALCYHLWQLADASDGGRRKRSFRSFWEEYAKMQALPGSRNP